MSHQESLRAQETQKNQRPNWVNKLSAETRKRIVQRGYTTHRSPYVFPAPYVQEYESSMNEEIRTYFKNRSLLGDSLEQAMSEAQELISQHRMKEEFTSQFFSNSDPGFLAFAEEHSTVSVFGRLRFGFSRGYITQDQFKWFLEDNSPMPLERLIYWLMTVTQLMEEARFQYIERKISKEEYEEVAARVGEVDARMLLNLLLGKENEQNFNNQTTH